MTNSIYHFFRLLADRKFFFKTVKKLSNFPFDKKMLACVNNGVFPDLAIRLNKDREVFTGGEFIELKDSNFYAVSSFNSTIPSRSKRIEDIIAGDNSVIKKQMDKAGNDIFSLPVRDVFYLVRGKKKGNIKVCLVYGSFFETVSVEKLIGKSFTQVLEEQLKKSGKEVPDDIKETLILALFEQQGFSKVRNVDKSSVKLRFRIMTEVKVEGNVLNSEKYPEIKDNTLNFVLPCHDAKQEQKTHERLKKVFSKDELRSFDIIKVKHHFNGYFLVIQTKL